MAYLNHVTSFSMNALRDWLLQRVSAVVMAVYVIFLIGYCFLHPQLNFWEWHSLFAGPIMGICTTIFFLAAFVHARIGLWRVTSDYIKPACVRLSVQFLFNIALLGCLIWGIAVVWSL